LNVSVQQKYEQHEQLRKILRKAKAAKCFSEPTEESLVSSFLFDFTLADCQVILHGSYHKRSITGDCKSQSHIKVWFIAEFHILTIQD